MVRLSHRARVQNTYAWLSKTLSILSISFEMFSYLYCKLQFVHAVRTLPKKRRTSSPLSRSGSRTRYNCARKWINEPHKEAKTGERRLLHISHVHLGYILSVCICNNGFLSMLLSKVYYGLSRSMMTNWVQWQLKGWKEWGMEAYMGSIAHHGFRKMPANRIQVLCMCSVRGQGRGWFQTIPCLIPKERD